MSIPVITIDGPSGAGKGTIAQQLAKRLGYRLLDSGAVYRAAAVHALRSGADLEDETCLLYTSPSPRDKRQYRMPSSA